MGGPLAGDRFGGVGGLVKGPEQPRHLARFGHSNTSSANGLAYLMDDLVQADVEAGRPRRVLADWCAPLSGYHLYYPSRTQPCANLTDPEVVVLPENEQREVLGGR